MFFNFSKYFVSALSFMMVWMPNQSLQSQNGDLYSLDQVQEMRLYFDYQDWDYRLDTAKVGKEDYILATSCFVNRS